MIRKNKAGIEWLEFELLQQFPNLLHGVILRPGGFSEGSFASLNMGGGTTDDPNKIEANRRLVKEALGLSELVSTKQVHGKEVRLTSELVTFDEECDAMITNEKNRPLMIKHADCQAALIYDPINKAIANVHCGWRGNVQNIYAETIRALQTKMGSKPENLFVCISPSLGPHHSQFLNYKTEFPPSFWEFQIQSFYFDLWEISRQQLLQEGVLPHHIEIAQICTFGNKEDYFSYRRDRLTGRNATIFALQ